MSSVGSDRSHVIRITRPLPHREGADTLDAKAVSCRVLVKGGDQDTDGDGNVGILDLLLVLANWT